jgi:hypothetical protein
VEVLGLKNVDAARVVRVVLVGPAELAASGGEVEGGVGKGDLDLGPGIDMVAENVSAASIDEDRSLVSMSSALGVDDGLRPLRNASAAAVRGVPLLTAATTVFFIAIVFIVAMSLDPRVEVALGLLDLDIDEAFTVNELKVLFLEVLGVEVEVFLRYFRRRFYDSVDTSRLQEFLESDGHEDSSGPGLTLNSDAKSL